MSHSSYEKKEESDTNVSVTSKDSQKDVSTNEETVMENMLNQGNKSTEASVRFAEPLTEIAQKPSTSHSSEGFHDIPDRLEEPSSASRRAHDSLFGISYKGSINEENLLKYEEGNKGKTDAHYAAEEGDLERLSKMNHPSKLNVRDDDGWSPIMYAALSGQLVALEHLKNMDADMKALDIQGRSLLHIAASFGHEHIINWMLGLGFDINASDFYKMTPLHMAAASNQVGVTRLLIANGADPTIQDDRNRTPLKMAQIAGHPEIIDLLRDYKKDDF